MFHALAVAFVLGWSLLFLKYPVQSCRVLSLGRAPTPTQLKGVRSIGYAGVVLGGAGFLLKLVLRLIH
jgi:putative N-acetylmannosamine-6-phosphate epimerase